MSVKCAFSRSRLAEGLDVFWFARIFPFIMLEHLDTRCFRIQELLIYRRLVNFQSSQTSFRSDCSYMSLYLHFSNARKVLIDQLCLSFSRPRKKSLPHDLGDLPSCWPVQVYRVNKIRHTTLVNNPLSKIAEASPPALRTHAPCGIITRILASLLREV